MLKRVLCVVCFLPLPSLVHGQACVPPVQFPQQVKAPIRNVTFTNDEDLSQEKKLEVVKQLRDSEVDPKALDRDVSGIAEEAAERVRAAFQDEGYFKAQVTSKAVRVVADKQRYDILVQIRAVGTQYRLGDLRIANATRFPTQQLRDLFPIQHGEIFGREKIAAGLEALGRLYDSEGYINYTGVPDTEFDEDNAIANLKINVDEGKQFRLRNVEVLGLDEETKTRVLSELDTRSGDVFNSESRNRSLLKFPGAAQNPAPNLVHKRLDERNGRVDLVLDFRKPRICMSFHSGPPILSTEDAPSAK